MQQYSPVPIWTSRQVAVRKACFILKPILKQIGISICNQSVFNSSFIYYGRWYFLKTFKISSTVAFTRVEQQKVPIIDIENQLVQLHGFHVAANSSIPRMDLIKLLSVDFETAPNLSPGVHFTSTVIQKSVMVSLSWMNHNSHFWMLNLHVYLFQKNSINPSRFKTQWRRYHLNTI